ncbi:hypothetical protein MVES_003380 [Malassezia vespertilionis]|uniref:Uncharacterized protein n=1 Tax=Malassezia vespertilionis TaxID=2020962 RepID=A0A2N1J7R4_9BASI|nr:hypothetical protein MVES_003380 [Malassezia vespertilionis]
MEPQPHAGRRWLLRGATLVQTGTALTLGSVFIVHLAAPVVAALGGAANIDWANQTLLLGREYYQNALLEPIVVYGAFGAHVLHVVACLAAQLEPNALDVRNMAQRRRLPACPMPFVTYCRKQVDTKPS